MKGKYLLMIILFLLGIFWMRGLMSQTIRQTHNDTVKITYEVLEEGNQMREARVEKLEVRP